MASASSTAVWSFHSTNMAFGLSANSGRSASTRPSASTGAGVEPVLSTPIHDIGPLGVGQLRQNGFDRRFHRLDVVPRVVTELVVWRIAVAPLLPARIPLNAGCYLRQSYSPLPARELSRCQNRGQLQLPWCCSIQNRYGRTLETRDKNRQAGSANLMD